LSVRFLLVLASLAVLLQSPARASDLQLCTKDMAAPQTRVGACTRAIAKPPRGVELWALYFARGNAWLANGRQVDRALTDFREASRLAPQNFVARNNLANAHFMLGDFENAVAVATAAIPLNPKSGIPYLIRGSAWQERGDFEKALDDYDKALQIDPRNTTVLLVRGRLSETREEFDQAIADYNSAVRLDPRNGSAYADRGRVRRKLGDLNKALADQNLAIRVGRRDLQHRFLSARGDTYRYRGDYKLALADYDVSLRFDPAWLPALVGRGLTYERMGDVHKAIDAFRAALSARDQEANILSSRESREIAKAHLAALESGVAPPVIPSVAVTSTSATSRPTAAIKAPAPDTPVSTRHGRRVAMVIGNAAYKNVPELANPRKDADAVATSLRNIGFDSVRVVSDATRETLIDALRMFANEAENADWALVYYAGHGIEVSGQNYLIPIEARLAVDRDVQFEAIPLEQVLVAIEATRKLKLIILDACRDNPFAPQMRKTPPGAAVASASTSGGTVGARSVGRGLGEVQVQGASLVVFAAKHGQTALDGEGENSPFAIALVQRIATPGVEINKIFRLVRDDVLEATAGRQEPYTYGSLPGREDFFFVAR